VRHLNGLPRDAARRLDALGVQASGDLVQVGHIFELFRPLTVSSGVQVAWSKWTNKNLSERTLDGESRCSQKRLDPSL
jgi:hypothetical protein